MGTHTALPRQQKRNKTPFHLLFEPTNLRPILHVHIATALRDTSPLYARSCANMNTLIILAYIWLPGALVFTTWISIPGYLSVWSPDWSPTDKQRWDDRRARDEHPGALAPRIILKDVVETTHWRIYAIILLA
jgi:hypothetical protein